MKQVLTILLFFFVVGCGGSDESNTNEPQPPPKPEPPQNLRVTSITGDPVVTWDETGGRVDLYLSTDLEFTTDNYSVYDGGQWIQDVEPPYTVDNLTLGPIWHFVAVAVESDQESEESNRISAITRYEIREGGTVVYDAVTGLEWKRCIEDMKFNNDTGHCEGQAIRVGPDTGPDYDTPNADGWRAPTHEELKTIVYCPEDMGVYLSPDEPQKQCSRDEQGEHDEYPSIYIPIFPNTIQRAYYTSTRKTTSGGIVYVPTVAFNDGSHGVGVGADDPYQLNLRLVRE